jgi:RNA recognition motif-containing protein
VPVEQAKSINLVPVPIDPEDLMSPCNTLSVRNLPSNVSEGELKALFSQRPGYKRLFFSRIFSRKSCSVEFEDEGFAIIALNDLYGRALHNSAEGGIRISFSKNPFHPATQRSTSKEQVEKIPKRKRDIDELVSSADLKPQKPFKSPFKDANEIPNISGLHGHRNSKIFVSYTISHDCTSNGESESARLLSALRGRPRDNKRNGMKFPP